ncbi:hypothetical protein [Subtercola sp. YIM 133946]|uniref:hypothetical protein n=1 Tax=Subtercola sp. YIM 133946 TaxID=3118909 RepID=UPI002F925872
MGTWIKKADLAIAGDKSTSMLFIDPESDTYAALVEAVGPIIAAQYASDPTISAALLAGANAAVAAAVATGGIAHGVVQTGGRAISGGVDADGRMFDDVIFTDGHFGQHTYDYIAKKLGRVSLNSPTIVSGGMDVDGRLFDDVIGLDGHFLPHTYAEIAKRLGSGSQFPEYAQPAVVAFGDSLTESIGTDWPTALGVTLGTSSINQGVSGQRAEHIAARMGGLRLFFTVQSNTIPSTPAERTLTLVGAYNGRSFGIGSNDYYFWGYMLGIQGEIVYGRVTQHTADGSWTFLRTDTGAAVSTFPHGAAFVVNQSEAYRDSILIIHAGRNNMYELPTSFQNVFEDVRRCVGRIGHDRFLVPTITYRIEEYNGGSGQARHDIIKSHNAKLLATYGNVETDAKGHGIDLCGWLQNRALAALGWTPTADDLTDIANDTIPRQLHFDETHFKPAVYLAWANWYASIITAKGWLTYAS